jgi:signal transduction histidine kinase/CheY-like chemotaxis protein
VKALRAHARLLADLLPASGETLKALIAVPSRTALNETRALFIQHRSALEAATQRFRLLLYFTSLALLAMLVLLLLRLRTRALERRRRAALERVIAQNSTRLINCPPAETGSRLLQVLSELCEAIGIERAYVVLDEKPERVIASGTEGTAYKPGWPNRTLKLYEQLSEDEPGIIRIGDTARLPAGDVKDALVAAGIGGWACVPLILPGGIKGIMGFDAFQPAGNRIFPLRVMRLAGDAVANAIEREYLERDRARLSAHLERARRMQIIGSLTSGVAHNFNNIIGAVLGHAEMAKPQLPPGTKPAEHIDEIQRAAERGRDLIDSILTFGCRREARVREVELKRLLKEAAALLRAALPAGIELVIAEVPDGVAVSGEPAQLQQVLLNLCSNAVQAMESPGTIRVTAEQKETAVPLFLTHGALSPGQYVCLAVHDTGRGFDETVARRLFEPFFTTRSGGTGLGLATVREIVQDHYGAMNVKSEPERGSRFEVWLPTAATASTSAQPPLPLGRGQTVMVVESHRERLLRDEEMLAALGYEPVGFERPEDALAACRSKPDRFDVILVNHSLQALGALDLARKLHNIAPARPLLLALPPSSDVSTEALADAGISEILPRPLVSTELAAALARTLRT